MSYNNLGNYYSTIFSMRQHHNYTITEIEELFPFEREIYLNMIIAYLKELGEKQNPKQDDFARFKNFGDSIK
jgi:subtilase family serine protease